MHRLDYDGRTDWVLTTLEDSDNPRMNGMVRRVSDGEHTISRPEFPVQAFPLEENELLSPGYWLALWDTVPEFERSTRADGDTELSRSESVDCTRESCPQSVGPMAEFRQLVVVNEERIPLLVDETLGSVVLYRMTLDDLTITEQ